VSPTPCQLGRQTTGSSTNVAGEVGARCAVLRSSTNPIGSPSPLS
jgi:hypothetical protein